MKVIWKARNYSSSMWMMQTSGIKFVKRLMHHNDGYDSVFITSKEDFLEMNYKVSGDHNPDGIYWQITSCNKQYVTAINDARKHHRYMGCMCKVTQDEAFDHVRSNTDNWYLLDVEANIRWIACKRNPNTMLGVTSPRFPKQERKWPLDGATYEDWKRGIVNNVLTSLEEAL